MPRSDLRPLAPLLAQEASYLAASAKIVSFPRRSIHSPLCVLLYIIAWSIFKRTFYPPWQTLRNPGNLLADFPPFLARQRLSELPRCSAERSFSTLGQRP